MPRKSPRRTLAKGIYLDGKGLELRAMVNGAIVRERVPKDTDLAEAIKMRRRMIATAHTEDPRPEKHTFAWDVPTYLRLHEHLVSYTSKRAIMRHWAESLGHLPRHLITRQNVLAQRVTWLAADVSAKSVNHRVHTLRHFYRVLDGKRAPTPCDDIKPLPIPRTPIQRVSDATILAVDARLQQKARTATGNRRFDGLKTLARFRVLASTGRRPSEVARAERADVDLEQRVWAVRDGKGGWSPGLYLNDDMLAAWTLFRDTDAWGAFSVSSYAKVLRRAGWPAGIRPYQLRHMTWITAVERGADMADAQIGAGHKSLETTRRHYTGVLRSRAQGLAERLEGRFGGFPDAPVSGPAD